MNKYFEWAGGKKVGLALIAIALITIAFALGMFIDMAGKELTSEQWLEELWKYVVLGVGSNLVGMGVHAFGKKGQPVSTEAKKKNGE